MPRQILTMACHSSTKLSNIYIDKLGPCLLEWDVLAVYNRCSILSSLSADHASNLKYASWCK